MGSLAVVRWWPARSRICGGLPQISSGAGVRREMLVSCRVRLCAGCVRATRAASQDARLCVAGRTISSLCCVDQLKRQPQADRRERPQSGFPKRRRQHPREKVWRRRAARGRVDGAHNDVVLALTGSTTRPPLRQPSANCSTNPPSHHFSTSARPVVTKSGRTRSNSRTALLAAAVSPNCP